MRSIDTVSKPAARPSRPRPAPAARCGGGPGKRRASSERTGVEGTGTHTEGPPRGAGLPGSRPSGLASRNTPTAPGVANARCARHAWRAPELFRRQLRGRFCPRRSSRCRKARGHASSGAARATSSTRRSTKRSRAGEAGAVAEKSQYGQMAEQKGAWRDRSPGLLVVVVVSSVLARMRRPTRDFRRSPPSSSSSCLPSASRGACVPHRSVFRRRRHLVMMKCISPGARQVSSMLDPPNRRSWRVGRTIAVVGQRDGSPRARTLAPAHVCMAAGERGSRSDGV